MKHVALALLLVAGCSSSADTPDTTSPDAGDAAPTPGAGGSSGGGAAGAGGAAGKGGAGGSGGGTAGTGGGAEMPIDAAADRPVVTDAGQDTAEASLADRQGGDGAGGDSDALAPDVVDAAADVRVDVGADVRVDAVDAGIVPVCPAITNPKCQSANQTDADVRATFPQPCAPEGQAKCGGVYYGPPNNLTETLPILCRSGMWRLGGSWSGSQWVPSHDCSTGCAASQICDP